MAFADYKNNSPHKNSNKTEAKQTGSVPHRQGGDRGQHNVESVGCACYLAVKPSDSAL